jgi:hypothetical protein
MTSFQFVFGENLSLQAFRALLSVQSRDLAHVLMDLNARVCEAGRQNSVLARKIGCRG